MAILLFQVILAKVLIIDVDPNHSSGSYINYFLFSKGISVTYLQSFTPDSLRRYKTTWLFLGVYSAKYVLDSIEIEAIEDFLMNGGSLYIEGGDAFGIDPMRGKLDSLLGIDPERTEDGTNDLFEVEGKENLLIPSVAGLRSEYDGERFWIDRLHPFQYPPFGGVSQDFLINPTSFYSVGIAYNSGTWKTAALSFELSGLRGEVRDSIIFEIVKFLSPQEKLGENYFQVDLRSGEGRFFDILGRRVQRPLVGGVYFDPIRKRKIIIFH